VRPSKQTRNGKKKKIRVGSVAWREGVQKEDVSQPFFFNARFLISLKEETYLARKGASARALVAVACMVFVSVSYDVNVEPAKVVLTRVSFVTKKKVSRENVLFVFFFWRYGFLGVCFSRSFELFFVFCLFFVCVSVCEKDHANELTVEM
jgi:hypothetical protein